MWSTAESFEYTHLITHVTPTSGNAPSRTKNNMATILEYVSNLELRKSISGPSDLVVVDLLKGYRGIPIIHFTVHNIHMNLSKGDEYQFSAA